MGEQLISFETAKLAKEKGFPNNLLDVYAIENFFWEYKEGDFIILIEEWGDEELARQYVASAPTQSLLQKWLREKHNLHVEVWYNFFTSSWESSIFNLKKGEENLLNKNMIIGKSYEEVLEKGLYESLKMIENGK